MSDDKLHQKLDEIRGEVKSLHTRHDNHDQQLGYLDHKLDRIRRMLAAALRFDGKAFLDAWHNR